mgnify:CR=1 FL=1
MSDSDFKVLSPNNIATGDDFIKDNTLDNLNASKECEDTSDSEQSPTYVVININNTPHCVTTIDNIDNKMYEVASEYKNRIMSYDNEMNIYKKNQDLIITTRYLFYVLSYESISATISYDFVEDYKNLYK